MKKESLFALVDCNNFFVSCERVFNPSLENKPLVVLSSNDGCAISRSNEAKALGVAMGEPFFKFKYLFETKKLEVLSSNFHLYINMSWRVMEILRSFCPSVEVYSIDEAFLDLSDLKIENYEAFAQQLRNKIKQYTGIPVSIGIAKTKTLAKIANYFAKKNSCVFNLNGLSNLDDVLATFPVEEIWGVGRKLAPKLKSLSIFNALDLKNSDHQKIRKLFSILEEKIIHELRGISCIDSVAVQRVKKSIAYTRSFGASISSFQELEEALVLYTSKAAEKLRKQESRAQNICIYIRTNRFSKDPYYQNSISLVLPCPTCDTMLLIKRAKEGLNKIFKEGYKYQKLGVILSDIHSDKFKQLDMFIKFDSSKSDKLMQVMDKINSSIGRDKVIIASQGKNNRWSVKKDLVSPKYTSLLSDVPIVK